MTRYVVATRREAETSSLSAVECVMEIPGVRLTVGHNPNCITIEASEAAAAEIERQCSSMLLIEPEIDNLHA